MSTTKTTSRTRTRAAKADTSAAKALPRDLDESDVIADAGRMADELAVREAAAKPAPRRSRKAAPAQAETPAPAAPAAPKARRGKAAARDAAPQPQQPVQPVEAEKAAAEDKPAPTPRLNQAEMVLAFLRQHPGEDFSPQAVSKAITPEGRKPLGVRDSLARLAAKGEVEVTQEKPLRYRITAA